jgi:cytochrome c-type biogenesis protein
MTAAGLVTRQRAGLGVSLAVLTGAVLAALLTGARIGAINGSIEALATTSSTWVGRLSDALPFGYAFGAGMVAAVNPCGFALLPAYLGLYLRESDGAAPKLLPRLGQSLLVSGAMTLAFVLVFGVAGIVLGAASAALVQYLPWIGLAVGVVLIFVGGRVLGGAAVYSSMGERIAGRLGARAQEQNPRGYFAYGLAYAAASLSCVLPIFLGVVAGSLAAGGLAVAIAEFVLYALGMGFVIAVLTAATAFLKHGAVARVRGLVRYVEPASAALLLLAGGYIVYYWLTIGGILATVGLRL